MDDLETAVIAVFAQRSDEELDTFKDLARDYSHLFRFGHTQSTDVAQRMGFDGNHAEVLISPAARLVANNPRASSFLQFPGTRIAREPLKTFLFMESK